VIISKTPFRMSFVGGGSDSPAYYRYNEGAVLSTSIDKYMYVTVNQKFDGNIRLSYSTTEDASHRNQIKHPVVRNVLDLMNISGGIEIASMADIPSKGSGLGSSSSYTVALLHALHAYKNEYISQSDLARLASYVEIEMCGDPIGKQDQYAAAFGGLNLIRFHEDDSVTVDPIISKPETIKKLENSILVFYTGRTRSSSAILSSQNKNMQNSQKRDLMGEMVKMSYDMKILLESGEVDGIGELLDKNWRIKCQMASGVTDSQIDDWYQKGINAGAKGGKLLGAGNGGFMMFFAPPNKHKEIIKAMSCLREIPFSFDLNGSQIVYYQPNTSNFLK
jgi:D-glycero-alpha-D-manno-heptose-7-phosphate kinase